MTVAIVQQSPGQSSARRRSSVLDAKREFVRQSELIRMLGCSNRYLSDLERRGIGPKRFVIDRAVFDRLSDVDKWVEENTAK